MRLDVTNVRLQILKVATACLVGAGILASLAIGSSWAGAEDDLPNPPISTSAPAVVVEVTGLLDPVMAELIENSIAEASSRDAVLLAFRVDSTQAVVSDERLVELANTIANSAVPIAVWVGPNGSALEGKVAQTFGVADALGIAPGIKIGKLGPALSGIAQHPVVWSNQELLRNHKLSWRELIASEVIGCEQIELDDLAVRYQEAGIAFNPAEVRVPPIEEQCVAPVIGDFLVDLDHLGFASQIVAGDNQPRLEPITQVEFRGLSLADQLFHTVASPPIAYILLTLGMGLMLFEFYTAGVGVAGVVGALLFVLGGYGLSVLPFNAWALGLLAGSMVAFGIDIQTSVPRFWTGAGLVMFGAGTWWLYSEVSMSWIPMVVMMGAVGVAMISGMPSMVRTRFSTPTIGRNWMIGELGTVVEDVSPDGVVKIRGALWRARVNRATPVHTGSQVKVVEIDGLWLQVEPTEGAARDYRERRS
ncbi:MAG: hypothetical protein OXE04_09300 [bacterium]|nr:hypothetical protein [bacterium]